MPLLTKDVIGASMCFYPKFFGTPLGALCATHVNVEMTVSFESKSGIFVRALTTTNCAMHLSPRSSVSKFEWNMADIVVDNNRPASSIAIRNNDGELISVVFKVPKSVLVSAFNSVVPRGTGVAIARMSMHVSTDYVVIEHIWVPGGDANDTATLSERMQTLFDNPTAQTDAIVFKTAVLVSSESPDPTQELIGEFDTETPETRIVAKLRCKSIRAALRETSVSETAPLILQFIGDRSFILDKSGGQLKLSDMGNVSAWKKQRAKRKREQWRGCMKIMPAFSKMFTTRVEVVSIRPGPAEAESDALDHSVQLPRDRLCHFLNPYKCRQNEECTFYVRDISLCIDITTPNWCMRCVMPTNDDAQPVAIDNQYNPQTTTAQSPETEFTDEQLLDNLDVLAQYAQQIDTTNTCEIK